MPNTINMLLTAQEKRALYYPPVLCDIERKEYFSFNDAELKLLNSFQSIADSVYFAISLAFFKLKYTLVDFKYQEVTKERQYIIQRYFPTKPIPRSFSNDKDVIARIENKVLIAAGFKRFRGEPANHLVSILQKQAPSYPRQRQLCKAFLNLG